MIVAGVGCRTGASARDVEAAIASARDRAGVTPQALSVIATAVAKAREPGIAAAAFARGVTLVVVPQADLEAAGARVMTRSERVAALMGVPSIAEAAALAAAGSDAQLVGPRIALGPVTCALATTGDAT